MNYGLCSFCDSFFSESYYLGTTSGTAQAAVASLTVVSFVFIKGALPIKCPARTWQPFFSLPEAPFTPKFRWQAAKVVLSLVRCGPVTLGHCISLGLIFPSFERRGRCSCSPDLMGRQCGLSDPARARLARTGHRLGCV